ncbi:MAG: P-II family nitrogen regulator [Ignavibacterium sp.]|jgi:nitrogen regulatory protein P-II 1|nr:P-II family nitrogen regulator [Ignavibacterium sp.]
MKEIKAYIRPEKADKVIFGLESAGAKGMTVIDVSTLGGWVDPKNTKLSIEYCEKYCRSIKIELVCEDDELNKFVGSILENAHTGSKGDGKIFISDITDSISIRTKQKGIKAL